MRSYAELALVSDEHQLLEAVGEENAVASRCLFRLRSHDSHVTPERSKFVSWNRTRERSPQG